jgi:hypothetical protein
MATLKTYDDIYRARLVWLGPPGYLLPIHLPYAEWGLFGAIAGALIVAGWVLTGGFASIGFAIGIAMFATSSVWRHVDQDLPARKILAVAVTDWRHTKPPAETRLPAMSARRIRIGGTP